MLTNSYYILLNEDEKRIYSILYYAIKQRRSLVTLPYAPSDKVLTALLDDNPNFFYWNARRLKMSVVDNVLQLKLKYRHDQTLSARAYMSAKVILKKCWANAKENIVRNLYNYFTNNIVYDSEKKNSYENHTAIGPLLYGKGVCEGIARAFQYILNLVGIECTVIKGVMNQEAHMWNIVELDGHNYHLDVTSDLKCDRQDFNAPSYFYYMLTDDEIAKSRTFDTNFNCNCTDANPFYRNNLVFYDTVTLNEYLSNHLASSGFVCFVAKNIDSSRIEEIIKNNAKNYVGKMQLCIYAQNDCYYIF